MLGYAHYVPGVHMLLGVGVSHQRHNRGQTPEVCVGSHSYFNLSGNLLDQLFRERERERERERKRERKSIRCLMTTLSQMTLCVHQPPINHGCLPSGSLGFSYVWSVYIGA